MKDYQKILFPYAYNILGSSEDAKDAIQDVLSNYISAAKENIENEKAYLVKAVINQSINIRNKRKTLSYEEVWLPEPVATEEADTNINLRDVISYSMLILLEQLNPKERAVFILKEGFGYSHQEIAEVLSGTIENSRKLLSRAKAKLEQSKQPAKIVHKDAPQTGVLDKYINAIRGRDVKALEEMLSADITFSADGGGMNVVKKRCAGIHDVADLLIYIYHKYQTVYTVVEASINHQPALLYYYKGVLRCCQVLSISDDGREIFQISTVLDPKKLKNIG